MPYYHAMEALKKPLTSRPPKGFYEAIHRSGCPEPKFGDPLMGYPISKIAESSFSKSIEGAILGGAKGFCDEEKTCEIDIYESDEEPDVDISDCPPDFDILEEVRYRREIPVKRVKTITISPDFYKEFEFAYQEEVVNTDWLSEMKEFVQEQLRQGKTTIPAISKKWKEKKLEIWLKEIGMTRELYETYQKRAKEMPW
jgi:hypothetical protein